MTRTDKYPEIKLSKLKEKTYLEFVRLVAARLSPHFEPLNQLAYYIWYYDQLKLLSTEVQKKLVTMLKENQPISDVRQLVEDLEQKADSLTIGNALGEGSNHKLHLRIYNACKSAPETSAVAGELLSRIFSKKPTTPDGTTELTCQSIAEHFIKSGDASRIENQIARDALSVFTEKDQLYGKEGKDNDVRQILRLCHKNNMSTQDGAEFLRSLDDVALCQKEGQRAVTRLKKHNEAIFVAPPEIIKSFASGADLLKKISGLPKAVLDAMSLILKDEMLLLYEAQRKELPECWNTSALNTLSILDILMNNEMAELLTRIAHSLDAMRSNLTAEKYSSIRTLALIKFCEISWSYNITITPSKNTPLFIVAKLYLVRIGCGIDRFEDDLKTAKSSLGLGSQPSHRIRALE